MTAAFDAPYPYEIWADGVFRPRARMKAGEAAMWEELRQEHEPTIKEPCPSARRAFLAQIHPRPLTIRRVGHCIDTDESWVELHQLGARTRTEWTSMETVCNRQHLVPMSKRNFAFNSETAGGAVRYLSDLLNSKDMDSVDMARRSGFHEVEGGGGWLIGDDWIGPPGTRVRSTPEHSRFTEALVSKGSVQGWLARFAQLIEETGPVARWLTYASFAGPLVRFLPFRSFVLHHFGESSQGKSSLLMFGASAWGRPKPVGDKKPLILTFDTTPNALIGQFSLLNDLTIFVDELQAASVSPKKVLETIYRVVGGVSRDRLERDGTLQKGSHTWSTVMRTTGEQQVVSPDIDLGGGENRVLQLAVDAMSSTQAHDLHTWMEGPRVHYGTAGRAFARALVPVVNNESKLARLRERSLEIHQELERRTDRKGDQRILHLACIAVAQTLVNMAFFGADHFRLAKQGAIETALEVAEHLHFGEKESHTQKVLSLLQGHLHSEPERYVDLRDVDGHDKLKSGHYDRLVGIRHPKAGEAMWYVPRAVDRIISEAGHHPGRFWSDMKRDGRIVADRDRRVVRRQADTWGPARVYVVKARRE